MPRAFRSPVGTCCPPLAVDDDDTRERLRRYGLALKSRAIVVDPRDVEAPSEIEEVAAIELMVGPLAVLADEGPQRFLALVREARDEAADLHLTRVLLRGDLADLQPAGHGDRLGLDLLGQLENLDPEFVRPHDVDRRGPFDLPEFLLLDFLLGGALLDAAADVIAEPRVPVRDGAAGVA